MIDEIDVLVHWKYHIQSGVKKLACFEDNISLDSFIPSYSGFRP